MATRVNTKFVIILASVLVLVIVGVLGLGAYGLMKKSADDHVRIAEQAMADGRAAIEAGDIEAGNSLFERAANNYRNAKGKEPRETEHLYKYIEAQEAVICDDLTLAYNQMDFVLGGALGIHDTPGASDDDRAYMYELLNDRRRMGLLVNDRPALADMISLSGKRLSSHDDDKVALKYNAIGTSFLVEGETGETKREEYLENLTTASDNDPEDPWVRAALGRYHLGDARRLYRAQGSAFTADVNATFFRAYEELLRARELAADNPPAMVEVMGLMLELRTQDEAATPKIIGDQIETARALHTMLQDKKNRDQLYAEELSRAVRAIGRMGLGNTEHPFDGSAYARELAEQVVEDRPDEPAAYALLGSYYRERGMTEEASATIEKGLKLDRLTNGLQFIRDQSAEADMLSTLVEVKINQAAVEEDPDGRTALLVEASKRLQDYDKLPTPQSEWKQARIQFLRGRIDYVYGTRAKLEAAVVRFDRANETYDNSNIQTLELLAETHRRLNNDGMVKTHYERLIELQPMSPRRLNLVQLYLTQPAEGDLERAERHLNQYLSLFPDNLTAIRLKAALYGALRQYDQAIALLEPLVETNPEVQVDIAGFMARQGNTEVATDLYRQRLANTPEGEAMNIALVDQLLRTLPTLQAKLDELDRLEARGLDPEMAEVFRKFSRNGRLQLEDELTLLDAQGHEGAHLAIRRFLVYQRWNQTQEAQAELDKAIRLDPMLPLVIEWRFRTDLRDQDWDGAQRAIADMLKLDVNQRPQMAVAEGAFMKAQLISAQAVILPPGSDERDKMLRDAAGAYDDALDVYNHYPEGWVQLGRVQIVQANFFAAQDSLRKALELQSGNIQAMELLARAEVSTGDEARAMDRYEQILRIQPGNATALDAYTALAQKLGVPARAITQRQLIRDRVPSNLANRRQLALLYAEDLSYDRAKAEIDAVIADEGKTQENMRVLARVLVRGDKKDRAVDEMGVYLAERGDEADAVDHLLMAQVYEWTEQRELADAAFKKAIELEDPAAAQASLAWAQVLLARGETMQSAAVFERLSASMPDNQPLKLQLAQIYMSAGDFEKAEQIARTLEPAPERSQLLVQAVANQPGKVAVAVELAREGVKDFPSNVAGRLQLGRLLLTIQERRTPETRDYTETMRIADQLVRQNPDRVEAQLFMADVHLAMGSTDEAVGQLEQILEFAPTHLPANERLYSILIGEARNLAITSVEASQSKAREALSVVGLLLRERPELPMLHRRAGEAAELAGEDALAVDYYRQAFEMTQSPQDLASYANALLVIGEAADARSVLENDDNRGLVAANLFLRALRGRALAGVGETDMAAALFGNVLSEAHDANNTQALELLARQATLAFKDDPQRAVTVITGAVDGELSPMMELVLSSLMIEQRYFAQAAERLGKYERTPAADLRTQFTILMQLALARQESDQLDASKATYEKALSVIQSNPGLIPMRQHVHLLNNLAYLLADRMTGSENQAVRYAREALELLPANEAEENVALIEDTLGWALYKAGQLEEAILVLQSSIDKYELAANQLHLGQAYLAKGQPDKALLVLGAARNKARNGDDPDLLEEVESWYQKALQAG